MNLGLGLGQKFQQFGNGLRQVSAILHYIFMPNDILSIHNQNSKYRSTLKNTEDTVPCSITYLTKT